MIIYRRHRTLVHFLAAGLVILAFYPPRANAASSVATFRPVSPEELKMTAEPLAPGAPAIILYREVDRDDFKRREEDYFRIKILTEEGGKYASIEIPFVKDLQNISGITARTIKPDGAIVDFDGVVTTKSVIKGRGFSFLAKTFTLPDIQPGCIIEYFYTVEFRFTTGSEWVLSNELFTKSAKFSLRPNGDLPWHSLWRNMPPGTPHPQTTSDKTLHLELINFPAFLTEDLMPPENELKSRVEFIYGAVNSEPSPAKYWNDFGKRWNTLLEGILENNRTINNAAADIAAPDDPPEVKLQKIYARVQALRNTSYDNEEKTTEERQREREKAANSLGDVWKHGYGSAKEINWLYLALVRAAGFDASAVLVPSRAWDSFDPKLMQGERLSASVVLVKLDGKEVWCDPGSPFMPYGLLPWPETAVQGLLPDKSGSTWVHTLVPTPTQTRTERHADLTLSEDGNLEGTVTVTFSGLEAARQRSEERNADDTERKTHLEDMLKACVPMSAEVKLTNQPDWKNPGSPLAGAFSLKVPGWGAAAGRRVIVPVGLFSAHEKHLFDHAQRAHPIYVEYPYSESDDIDIQIPAGWKVSSLPKGWQDTGKVVTYSFTTSSEKEKLHLARSLTVDFILMDAKYYPALRAYFQQIKSTDDQQVVLETAGAAAK